MLDCKHAPRNAASGVTLSDFIYLRLRQLSATMMLARSIIIAFLRPHVAHIIALSSKRQVARIDAIPIVTTVEYFKSFGDRAVMQHPRHTMGLSVTVIPKPADCSVAAARPGKPRPTLIWSAFADLLPKAPEVLVGR